MNNTKISIEKLETQDDMARAQAHAQGYANFEANYNPNSGRWDITGAEAEPVQAIYDANSNTQKE